MTQSPVPKYKTHAQRFLYMLELQEEPLEWLARHVSRIYDEIEKLRMDVSTLKASRTRARKKPTIKKKMRDKNVANHAQA